MLALALDAYPPQQPHVADDLFLHYPYPSPPTPKLTTAPDATAPPFVFDPFADDPEEYSSSSSGAGPGPDRLPKVEFLRQREWVRRVEDWVDTVSTGVPQSQTQQQPQRDSAPRFAPRVSTPSSASSSTFTSYTSRSVERPASAFAPSYSAAANSSAGVARANTFPPHALPHARLHHSRSAPNFSARGAPSPYYAYTPADDTPHTFYSTAAPLSPPPPPCAPSDAEDEPYLIYSTPLPAPPQPQRNDAQGDGDGPAKERHTLPPPPIPQPKTRRIHSRFPSLPSLSAIREEDERGF